MIAGEKKRCGELCKFCIFLLAGNERGLDIVTVLLFGWSCQSGYYG